jgi:ribose-phosphate pyrophosphokinase
VTDPNAIALLPAVGEQTSSVELSTNAKGAVRVTVKVHDHDPAVAAERAATLYDTLRARYAPAAGVVAEQPRLVLPRVRCALGRPLHAPGVSYASAGGHRLELTTSMTDERPRDRLVVLGGRSHPRFVEAICGTLQHPVGMTRLRTFSEGTVEVKLEENVRGRDVFVVQSGQERPNDHVLELLFLLDAARRASARSVTAVLPYFPYGKGDKKDEPRVSIRARVIADAIQVAGAGRVLTMDLHAAQIQGFFRVPVDNLYALPVLAGAVRAWVEAGAVERPVLVAPDAGAGALVRDYVRRLAGLGPSMALGDKVRAFHDERSEVATLLGEVRDRDAILADDIVFTGGSLANMAHVVHDAGARSVRAVVTHGLFTGDAVQRLRTSPLREVVVTDTVPLPAAAAAEPRIRQVSVAPLFAEAIRSIYEETSISRLFA